MNHPLLPKLLAREVTLLHAELAAKQKRRDEVKAILEHADHAISVARALLREALDTQQALG